MIRTDRSNLAFMIFGSIALIGMVFIVFFYSPPSADQKEAPLASRLINEVVGASAKKDLSDTPETILATVNNVDLPEITDAQYEIIKELVIASDPSLAELPNLDQILREPFMAQNIASLIEQVELNNVTPAQVRAQVQGASSGDFSPTGDDCAVSAVIIRNDPACYSTDVRTTIDETLNNYSSSGCDDGDPATPCAVRATSVIEPWGIYIPEAEDGYFAGSNEQNLTEAEKILLMNRQIENGRLAHLPSASGYLGSMDDVTKNPLFKQVNGGVANLLPPTSARAALEMDPNSKRTYALEVCAGGEEVCADSAKTTMTLPGVNSRDVDISPVNSNKNAEPDIFGFAIKSPGAEPQDEKSNQCVDTSDAIYQDVKKTELSCLRSRRVADIFLGIKTIGNDISCWRNSGNPDCALGYVFGIQVSSPFGDTEYSVRDSPSSNFLSQSMVEVYSSPTDKQNVTILRTECTIRIDYKKIVPVYCYFKNQNQYAHFQRQMAEKTPGDAFKYDQYVNAVGEEF